MVGSGTKSGDAIFHLALKLRDERHIAGKWQRESTESINPRGAGCTQMIVLVRVNRLINHGEPDRPAIWLVGTGFASPYRLQHKADFSRPWMGRGGGWGDGLL